MNTLGTMYCSQVSVLCGINYVKHFPLICSLAEGEDTFCFLAEGEDTFCFLAEGEDTFCFLAEGEDTFCCNGYDYYVVY